MRRVSSLFFVAPKTLQNLTKLVLHPRLAAKKPRYELGKKEPIYSNFQTWKPQNEQIFCRTAIIFATRKETFHHDGMIP
jgi:hypothetical protein